MALEWGGRGPRWGRKEQSCCRAPRARDHFQVVVLASQTLPVHSAEQMAMPGDHMPASPTDDDERDQGEAQPRKPMADKKKAVQKGKAKAKPKGKAKAKCKAKGRGRGRGRRGAQCDDDCSSAHSDAAPRSEEDEEENCKGKVDSDEVPLSAIKSKKTPTAAKSLAKPTMKRPAAAGAPETYEPKTEPPTKKPNVAAAPETEIPTTKEEQLVPVKVEGAVDATLGKNQVQPTAANVIAQAMRGGSGGGKMRGGRLKE
eukprot:4704640-Pyramimonas_sp.AAC.1